MEVKKSKRAAIENQRGTWLLMGFVVVLAFMFVTFEWTQHGLIFCHFLPQLLFSKYKYLLFFKNN